MKFMKIFWLTGLALTIAATLVTPLTAKADEKKDGALSLAFIRPDHGPEIPHAFFDDFVTAMKASSKALGDETTDYYSGEDHFKMLEVLKEITSKAEKPDAVVFMTMKNNGVAALDILETTGINSFIVNSGLSQDQTDQIGAPRENRKFWIGEMLPDDKGAGYALAEELYNQAITYNPELADTGVKLLAIEGNSGDGASISRVAGLKEFAAETENLEIVQILNGKWNADTAATLTSHALKRHKDIHIIWTASDVMAISSAQAATEGGRTVGTDVFVGGVDWSKEGLDAIENGTITASAGGHILEGAWAAIVLHDYFKGHDFAENEGLNLKSSMYVANTSNVTQVKEKLSSRNWESIDFKSYSKHYNPDIKTYNFGILDK